MYELILRPVNTIWNKRTNIYVRRETNDSEVVNSVMVYDEYKVTFFPYKSGDVFIDIGAHIGTWSVLMAIYDSSFKIYCYEPIPENYELIKANININGLNNQIYSFQYAVSDYSCGAQRIFYTNDATHKFVGSPQGGSKTIFEAQCISLNDIFEKNKINKCRVLKIDCEGCETYAFRTLKKEHLKKIDFVIGEFHPFLGVDREKFFSFFQPYFFSGTHKYLDVEDKGFGDFLYINKRMKGKL